MITKINAELTQAIYGARQTCDRMKLQIAKILKARSEEGDALAQLLSNDETFSTLVDVIASALWNRLDPLFNEEEYLLDTMIPFRELGPEEELVQAIRELTSLLTDSFGVALLHFEILPKTKQIDIKLLFAKD